MTCREAERLVMPYINGSITDEELKAFVEHIDHCPFRGRHCSRQCGRNA